MAHPPYPTLNLFGPDQAVLVATVGPGSGTFQFLEYLRNLLQSLARMGYLARGFIPALLVFPGNLSAIKTELRPLDRTFSLECGAALPVVEFAVHAVEPSIDGDKIPLELGIVAGDDLLQPG